MNARNDGLVIYRNELNAVSFKDFNSVEMDIYFAVCSQLKETHSDSVVLDLDKLRHITVQNEQSYDRFIQTVLQTNLKMSQLISVRQSGNLIEGFSLFPDFSINRNDNTMTVSVHPKFSYLINNVESEFTRYDMNEFTRISSRYTKTLFRQLKQYRDTGLYIVTVQSFRQIFDVPGSYRMSDIDRQILKPSIEELGKTFKNLKLEKIKKGRSVVRFKFTFEKQEHTDVEVEQLPYIPMYNWLTGEDE